MSHQPLPAKWVIKVTADNEAMVLKWAAEKTGADIYSFYHSDYYIYSERVGEWPDYLYDNFLRSGYEPITDTQFKAMVEGESKPQMEWEEVLIREINDKFIEIGYHKEATEWRAKHPEIWPVDWEKEIVKEAQLWANNFDPDEVEVGTPEYGLYAAVRNYLTNQK